LIPECNSKQIIASGYCNDAVGLTTAEDPPTAVPVSLQANSGDTVPRHVVVPLCPPSQRSEPAVAINPLSDASFPCLIEVLI